ncbi:MAG: family 20 glycosylhydrolase, partial [Clostridiales bacterium]|nr:family 20 glycosylhydrolase [Clostridiales bacterium]
LLYGCEAFFSLITGGTIPTCEISDKPFKEMRGFHMMLPPRDQLEFAKRVFRYVLLPMRYNQIFLEFAGGMRFDRHPEISEGWLQGNKAAADGLQPKFPHGTVAGGGLLEKDEVRDLVEYAKSLGFEVIPEVQSFGHVQYITYAHPEIAEIDEDLDNEIHDTRASDQPPDVFYYHSYCPMHDKSYEIIYDIIDEIVEVVKPERYVHMGHDEIYQIGLCSRCKNKNHAELYAKHVNRMYNYLKQKGLKMCIWSDMLQPTEKRYQTSPARTMIPKDILMLDFIWYFHFDLDMEDHILPYDFNVIVGNLYSSHYPRFETRIKKDHMLGGQVSTWCLFDEYNLAKKGKIFDIMYTAEMLWNSDYTSLARPVYNRVIGELIPSVRDELRGEIIRDDFIEEYNHIVLDGDDILPYEIYLAAESYDGELFNTDIPILADNYTINVSSTYDRLVFLHTTLNNDRRTAWEPLERVGSYIVNYLDGTREEIPIEYAGNICVWSRRYAEPLPQQYYRHQGYIATYFSDPIIETKTQDGRDITVLGFTWLNKYPEKVISNIVCVSSDKTDAKPILLALSGINVKKING